MHRASEDLSDPDRNMADPIGSPGPDEIQEDQDTSLSTILAGDDDSRKFTPPPRIAARFYRPTNSRRKSSAASSRRNSITSAHSHQSHASNRSYHGTAQSNHIAQHLRRASILESRKARLADRAAHAEKVRLRAALAKAAPRSTNNSEERALAAHQAREKNLAEIVASCAEEVKRAKGIAESMKEKREAEGKKLRREMEERLAEAEKRREEILNRGNAKRGRSLSMMRDSPSTQSRKSLSPMPEVTEAISDETAATRIQQKWRVFQRSKLLKSFAELGLSIEGVRDTSFEDVVALLAEEKVLISTAQILRLCGLREGESGSVNEMTAVRTFLSAFLILGHPKQVLSSKGESGVQEQVGVAPGAPILRDDLANPQLQDLVAKARDLLISFENVLSRLTVTNYFTPPPAPLATLSECYATFFNAFIAWKARDSNTLIDMMVLQFVELDAIWQTVKDSTEEAVTGSYREGIRENQLKLMVRIKRLAGEKEGKRLITAAIKEARKLRAKKPAGDSKPRAADGEPSSRGSVLGDLAGSAHAVSSTLQTLTPPSTPGRGSTSPTHVDELRTASSVIPDNRIVVHELAINKEYRIEMEDCLQQRGTINEMIFRSMRRDVQNGNSDPWVLAMAENIKGKLQRLLQPGNSMHTLIGDSLDLEIIAQELRCGGFSYEKFFAFMASILPRLCAPFRDDEVKNLVQNTLQNGDVVDRLEALMRFIDEMQLDYANFMLQQSAPELIKHAMPYEQKRFADDLDQGVHTLAFTEKWWKDSRAKVLAETARRDPEGINLPKNRPTPDKFYAQMLVDIFTDLGSGSDRLPETLALDLKRVLRIKTQIRHIVTAGAILLQSKNLLKRDVRSQWKNEASRIMSVLDSTKTAADAREGIQVALESSRSMPSATKAHIRELVRKIVENSYENAAASTSDIKMAVPAISEPVMRLLLTRLRGHILSRLSAITAQEKVKATSTASEMLSTLGLPEFVSQVGGIVEELGRVGMVDRESHAVWYEIVAKKVEAGAAS
jgi:hypothetical protein